MFIRKQPEPATPLRREVESTPEPETASAYIAQAAPDAGLDALKLEVHRRLIDEAEVGLFQGDTLSPEADALLCRLITETAQRRDELVTRARLDQLQLDLLSEIRGLGPLEPLMRDPAVSEIMVNARDQIYVE